MESDKIKSLRKRRRPAGSDATASESVLSDDAGVNKVPYSIRSRRQTKSTSDDTVNYEKGPSPSSSPSVTTTEGESRSISPALQQATRELHARIMSRVRDLAPTFKPAPITLPKPSETPVTNTSTSTPTANTPPPTPPTPPTPPASSTNPNVAKNTTRTVKELQHLISQYVQQQRANLGIVNSNTTPNSTPTSNITPNTATAKNSLIPNTSNTPRTDTINHSSLNNDSFQKSSIIANKFSNAINQYTRPPNTTTSTSAPRATISNQPTSSSHFPASEGKQFHPTGHEGLAARSTAPFTRPVTSTLDKNTPSLSIQFKHNQKEKRRKTEYGYYDDTSSNSSEGNSNYFLLAAQHELQNMDEEMAAIEKLELMEEEIERLQRAVAMRDRVINKLHDEIEEKDAIIQALPYELVSNWVAASHMMMNQ